MTLQATHARLDHRAEPAVPGPIGCDRGSRRRLVRDLRELGDGGPANDEDTSVGRIAVESAARSRAGQSVSPGFVVTTDACRDSLADAGLHDQLSAMFTEATGDSVDPAVRDELCRRMAALVRTAGPSAAVRRAVGNAYPALGIEDCGPVRVVVSPSPVIGPVEARLSAPVRGLRGVLDRVVDCWAALYEPPALAARRGSGLPETAVVVQAVPAADPHRRTDC